MTKPSPWGGEPERLEPCPWCGSTETPDVQVGCQGADEDYYYVTCEDCDAHAGWSQDRAEAIAAWNRRTPSHSPYGYEVQWRPRGSDTWDGGSVGVYRTREIAAEVARAAEDEGHETQVRAIAYLDGSVTQGPYPQERVEADHG